MGRGIPALRRQSGCSGSRSTGVDVAREVIFVRHGQTEWNVAGRLQGRGDSPLTELGRHQARAHAGWLMGLGPDRILASPLGRAQATAKILADALGLAVEIEPRLEERCMGRFEGWTLDEVGAAAPDEASARIRDPWRYRAPGGENYDDMLERVEPLLDELSAQESGRVVLVSHGTLVRPLLGRLLGLEQEAILRLRQPNAVAYQVKLDGVTPEVLRWEDGRPSPGLLFYG